MADSTVVPIRASDGGWDTADSSYSVDEFYTGASKDGQSLSKRVSMPPAMASQISALVQSGRFPYRTEDDFWRDCAHHRLHHLDEMGDLGTEFSRRIALWRRQEELDRHDHEMEATKHLIAETEKMVVKAKGIGDMVLLEQVVQQAEAAAADLHEPWKGHLLGTVEGCRDLVGGEQP